MKKKLTLTIEETVIMDLKLYALKNRNDNSVSALLEELATEFLNNEGENKMKNVQTLYYHDTTTGIYHKLYELTTDTNMDIDPLMEFAGLTVESIEEQLGFEIDVENLTCEKSE